MKRYRTHRLTLDRRTPRWQPAARLRNADSFGAAGRELLHWLLDPASLTKRLRQASGGDFRVKLLSQRWARPDRSERRALAMDDRATAWVRQVQLLCNGRVCVCARTVIPHRTLSGGERGLASLGGRSLGERLFRDNGMRRAAPEVARLEPDYELLRLAGVAEAAPLWGRRSLFSLAGGDLLVTEVFVPPLLKRGAQFRVIKR